MDLINPKEGENIVSNSLKDDPLRIVVTDGTTEVALALLYRIFSDNIFGQRSIHVCLHEFSSRAMFLESVGIQLAAFSPNYLEGVTHTHDASIAFKDADVVFCIGRARGYEFTEEEYTDLFFKECVLIWRFHAEAIEKYCKKNVKVIALESTYATIISQYAKSVPPKNITALSIFKLKLAAAHIADKANCLPNEIQNIMIWGNKLTHTIPDCKYMSLKNGKLISNELRAWMRNELPHKIQTSTNRAWYVRSLAYAMADHCSFLWHGTPAGEWTCMSVLSDNSYGIRSGIFSTFPVTCKNGEYEIVKDLAIDDYVQRNIEKSNKIIAKELDAALKICGLK